MLSTDIQKVMINLFMRSDLQLRPEFHIINHVILCLIFMQIRTFNFDAKMYFVPAIFLLTGFIVQQGMNDLSWIYLGAYLIGVLSLVLYSFMPIKMDVTEQHINVTYLWGKVVNIDKADVESFQRKTRFHKVEEIEWFFNMKSGDRIRITNTTWANASRMKEAVNDFCIGLKQEKN